MRFSLASVDSNRYYVHMEIGQIVRVFDSRGLFRRISQIEQVRTTKTGAVELKCFRCGWVALENVLPLKGQVH